MYGRTASHFIIDTLTVNVSIISKTILKIVSNIIIASTWLNILCQDISNKYSTCEVSLKFSVEMFSYYPIIFWEVVVC